MFIHYGDKLLNTNEIRLIQTQDLLINNYIRIYMKDDRVEVVEGMEAFNVVMELCPAALEGKGGEYARHAWAIHNLVGHPLMQILSWVGLSRLGIKIHDMTTPNPITK